MIRYCNKCKKELGEMPRAFSYICFNCKLQKKKESDKKWREKQGNKLKVKKKKEYYKGRKRTCENCGIEFERANWNYAKYCSRKCFHKESKKSRKLSGNPAWKNGSHSQTYNKMYFDNMYKTQGLLPEEIGCEVCHVMSGVTFDRHHIIFKSEMGWHKEINNPKNIIQVCRGCHLKFHGRKNRRDLIVLERGLEELFECKLVYE